MVRRRRALAAASLRDDAVQNHTPWTPNKTTASEIKRPTAENRAIETN
jgi:hypothetical protein